MRQITVKDAPYAAAPGKDRAWVECCPVVAEINLLRKVAGNLAGKQSELERRVTFTHIVGYLRCQSTGVFSCGAGVHINGQMVS